MSGTSRTINFPTSPNEGDLYSSQGRVFEFVDRTWQDVTSIYVAAHMRRNEPPQDGESYMRSRARGAVIGTWKKPEPLDLTPYLLRDGSQAMAGPLVLDNGQVAASRDYVDRVIAPLRAEVMRLRAYIGAKEIPDDPRGRARGRTY